MEKEKDATPRAFTELCSRWAREYETALDSSLKTTLPYSIKNKGSMLTN